MRCRGKYLKTPKEGDPRYDLNRLLPKNLILVLTLLTLPVFQSSSPAASDLMGPAAPYFRVQSGYDKELTLDMIKGKVAAIFYENKDIVDANKRLKDELNKLYSEQTDALKDVLVRLPIIDCADAFWPFRVRSPTTRGHFPKANKTISVAVNRYG
jgi:hypothetical protein